MPSSPSSITPHPSQSVVRSIWPLILLAFAGAVASAVWAMVALYSGHLCGWMAIPLALACVAALRLGGMHRRQLRMALTLAVTLLASALVAWLVIALQIGSSLGLGPLAAMRKLGPHLALTLLQLAATPVDFVGLIVALMLAGWLAK